MIFLAHRIEKKPVGVLGLVQMCLGHLELRCPVGMSVIYVTVCYGTWMNMAHFADDLPIKNGDVRSKLLRLYNIDNQRV